jgi:hypothetical protein
MCETPDAPLPHPVIRDASLDDLPFLKYLERTSFSPRRQSSSASLRNSIKSPSQMVLVIEGREKKKGSSGQSVLLTK